MDPLSDVLSLLNAHGTLSVRLAAGGNWCIQFPAYDSIRFGTLAEGACWLQVEGMPQAVRLQAGDCYLLASGRPYKLGSDLALQAVDMHEVYARVKDRVVYHGDRPDVQVVGGRFSLDATNAAFLLDSLPPLIHLRASSDQADMLAWVLKRLAAEQLADSAGSAAMVVHLTHMMLLQMLRCYVDGGDGVPLTGWLAALSDAQIGAALGLMHAEPNRRWTLPELAGEVAMSRSAFALRFKTLVGISPLDYLLRWRMRLAGRALATSKASVSLIGMAYGYESESAFSSAFKRVMGRPPREYRMDLGRLSDG